MKTIYRINGEKLFECNEIVDFIESTSHKDFKNANLIGADLSGANLIEANLRVADLSGANLSGANLIGANLIGADLSGANLIEANLSGANLIGADLSGANLRGADLSGADLSGANLIGANLIEANLIVYHYLKWTAYIQPDFVRIGCKYYAVEEWRNFPDEEIAKMDVDALEYWKANREIILMLADRLIIERQARSK